MQNLYQKLYSTKMITLNITQFKILKKNLNITKIYFSNTI